MEGLNAEPIWLARQIGRTLTEMLHMQVIEYDVHLIALSDERIANEKRMEELKNKENQNG